MILDSQKAVYNKAGLGYRTNTKQKFLKNIFVKAKNENVTCYCCNKIGHRAYECNFRKSSQNKSSNNQKIKFKKVWVPKGTWSTNPKGPNLVWVPKVSS